MELEAHGQLTEAETRLREGLALDTNDVGSLHALGLLLLRRERPDEARVLFERVIELHPDFAPAHAALGQVLEAVAGFPPPRRVTRRRWRATPDNLLARAGLASVYGRRGDHAAARKLGAEVLAAEPNYPPAAMLVAEAEIARGDTAQAQARLNALLEDPRLTPVERSLAFSALGDALDRERRERGSLRRVPRLERHAP